VIGIKMSFKEDNPSFESLMNESLKDISRSM